MAKPRKPKPPEPPKDKDNLKKREEYFQGRRKKAAKVNASDVDPTAGADPDFKWDGNG